MLFERSVREEIEDVSQLAAFHLEDLRVHALVTGHGGEPLVLNVQYLGQKTSGGPDLVHFIPAVAALGTAVVLMLHG